VSLHLISLTLLSSIGDHPHSEPVELAEAVIFYLQSPLCVIFQLLFLQFQGKTPNLISYLELIPPALRLSVRLISVASSFVTLALLFHISNKLKFISILLLRTVSLWSSKSPALPLLVSDHLVCYH